MGDGGIPALRPRRLSCLQGAPLPQGFVCAEDLVFVHAAGASGRVEESDVESARMPAGGDGERQTAWLEAIVGGGRGRRARQRA